MTIRGNYRGFGHQLGTAAEFSSAAGGRKLKIASSDSSRVSVIGPKPDTLLDYLEIMSTIPGIFPAIVSGEGTGVDAPRSGSSHPEDFPGRLFALSVKS